MDDDLRPEYDLDELLKSGVQGKYAERFRAGSNPGSPMKESEAKDPRKTKTVPYDVAEQLRTPEEMAAYLDAWFTEALDDVAGVIRALGDVARARDMSP